MLRKIVCFFCAVFFYMASIQAQHIVRGKVCDTDGYPLEYFNLVLENPADSTYLQGNTYYSETFECPLPDMEEVLLHFSSLGFNDTYVKVNPFSNAPIRVVMQPSVIDDVIVAARTVNVFRGKTTILVGGTALGNLSDVEDILKRVPSVRADKDEILIFGKGTPLIFIDNRKASYEELKLLLPSEIVSIEVDRNPSARYDAQYASCLRIKTNRTREGYAATIYEQLSLHRFLNNRAGLQAQFNTKKWTNFISISHDYAHCHNYSKEVEAVTIPGYSLRDTCFYDVPYKIHTCNLTYGSQFRIGTKGMLRWQYVLSHVKAPGDTDNSGEIIEHVIENDIPSSPLRTDTYKESASTRHHANIGYRIDMDTTSYFRVDADGLFSKSQQAEDLFFLQNNIVNSSYITNYSKNAAFEGQIEYGKKIGKMTLNAGVQYNYLSGDVQSDYDSDFTSTMFDNHTIGAYFIFRADYEKWGCEVGLRNEVTNDVTKNGDRVLRNKWENNLFPSISLYTNSLWESVALAFNYTSGIRRPSVWQLSPTLMYTNSITMRTGNPLLESAIAHSFSLTTTLYDRLSVSLEYDYKKNPILETGTLTDDGKIIFAPINVRNSHIGRALASYNNKWGIFSFSADVILEYAHTRIPFMDGVFTNKRWAFNGSWNASLQITKTTELSCSFIYQSRSADLMTVFEPINNLSVFCTQSLFKGRMLVSVGVYDIFRKTGQNWYDRYEYYQARAWRNDDTRFVRLSLRYNFNNSRPKYRVHHSSDVLERL